MACREFFDIYKVCRVFILKQHPLEAETLIQQVKDDAGNNCCAESWKEPPENNEEAKLLIHEL